MVNNARIADLIRENKAEEIPEAIEEGSFFNMQSFEQALIQLVISGEIDRETAANAATNQHDFIVALEHSLKRQAAGVDEARRDSAVGASRRGGSDAQACASPPAEGMRTSPAGVSPLAAVNSRQQRRAPTPSGCSPSTPTNLTERYRYRTSPADHRADADLGAAAIPQAAQLSSSWGAVAERRASLRNPVGGARVDQQGRVELRPQHGPELGRGGRLDAVHADHVGALGPGCERRRRRRSWNPQDAIYAAARYLAAAGGAQDISAPSWPTTTRSGTSTRCFSWRALRGRRRRHDLQAGPAPGLVARLSEGRRQGEPAARRALRDQRALWQRENVAGRRAPKRRCSSRDGSSSRRRDADRRPRERGRARVAHCGRELQRRPSALEQAANPGPELVPRRGRRCSSALPLNESGYVFPVGGGPRSSRSSHHHHDYPAADIAAPRARRSMPWPTASCRSWASQTHLRHRPQPARERRAGVDVLPPFVPRPADDPGAVLCGRPVGRARRPDRRRDGPHLHLQIDPPTHYPQLEPWFERSQARPSAGRTRRPRNLCPRARCSPRFRTARRRQLGSRGRRDPVHSLEGGALSAPLPTTRIWRSTSARSCRAFWLSLRSGSSRRELSPSRPTRRSSRTRLRRRRSRHRNRL